MRSLSLLLPFICSMSIAGGSGVVTTTADSGPGSLRAALHPSNLGGHVTFEGPAFAGDSVTINLSSPITISRAVILTGPQTAAGVNKVTITAPGLDISAYGTEVRTLDFVDCRGSAIRFTGNLQSGDLSAKVTGCRFTGNGGGMGGAIQARGTQRLEVRDCTFTNNWAEISGGAISSTGGGLVIYSSTFTGNQARTAYPDSGGGAIHSTTKDFVGAMDCHFTGNSAALAGGAIRTEGGSPDIVSCTFSGNSSATGSAIYAAEGTGSNLLFLQSITLSGNTATGGGSALQTAGALRLLLNNSTVTDNTSNSAGKDGPGGAVQLTGVYEADMTANIIAGNRDARATGTKTPDALFSGGPLTLCEGNIVGDATGAGADFSRPGNLAGNAASPIDPGLLPLAYNGGPTPTHEPHPLSPAVDFVTYRTNFPDQRGMPRLSGPKMDAGAFERQVTPYATWAAAALSSHPAEDRDHADDPDKDGIPNAIEYLQGTDPAGHSAATARLVEDGGQTYYAFRISAAATVAELAARVGISTDLEHWTHTPLAGNTTAAFQTSGQNLHHYLLPVDTTGRPRCFLRLLAGDDAMD